MFKVTVAYEHDPSNLAPIHLATSRRAPADADWKPALRDTVDGRLVVWARFPEAVTPGAEIWLRDAGGARRARVV